MYTAHSFSRYAPAHFRPGGLPSSPSYRNLYKLLVDELRLATRSGFGPGHVFYGIRVEELVEHHKKDRRVDGLLRFCQLVSYMRGALIPPENFELINRLNSGHRRHMINARALPEEARYDKDQKAYQLTVESRSKRRSVVDGQIVINCAALSRDRGRAPLSTHGITTPDCVTHGKQAQSSGSGIYCVGPPANDHRVIPRHWGIESFRDEVQEAARTAVVVAIGRLAGRMREAYNLRNDPLLLLSEALEQAGAGQQAHG